MRLLIVHREAEIGEALAAMVRDYTEHEAHSLSSAAAVPGWLSAQGGCDLLLAQLHGDGVDGLALRESLRDQFPALQTLFLPDYRLADQCCEVTGTRVFPEPIDGAGLLEAIAASAAHSGRPERWNVTDFVQMCGLGKQNGAMRVKSGEDAGVLHFREGQIVHAEMATARGEEAVCEIVALGSVDLSWDENSTPMAATIVEDWSAVLLMAITRGKERRARALAGSNPPRPLIAKPLRTPPKIVNDADGVGAMTGKDLGPYRVRRRLGEGEWGEVYEAEQTTMARSVALKILSSALQTDAKKAERFVADASAKANVQHPSVVAVYEAGEWNGSLFYAREFIPGETLATLKASGKAIDETVALRIVRAVADTVAYLKQKRAFYRSIDPARIFLASDGQPRLANPAMSLDATTRPSAQEEIQALGRELLTLVSPSGAAGGRVVRLLAKMQIEGANGVPSWAALLQQVKAIEPEIAPPGIKVTGDDEAARRALEEVKRRRRRGIFWSVIALLPFTTGVA